MTKKIINLMCLINRIVFSGLFSTKLTNGLSFVTVSILFHFIFNTSNMLDAPLPWQMNFQQPASPTMEGIIDLHHNIMIFMIYIVIFISYILIRAIMLFNSNKKSPYSTISRTRHHLSLEIIWTILPLLILFWIALPSFALLYSIDHCPKVDLTIKVIGRQWYWTYEIDAFVKHKVRKPTYMDLKETSIFYEILAELAKKLVEADVGDVKKVSCLTSDLASRDNLYLAVLYRLVNNNFTMTDAGAQELANSYLSLISRSRDEGVVQDLNVSDSKIKSKDHFIIKNSTLNYDLKSLEHWKMWKQFITYDDVPTVFQNISDDDNPQTEIPSDSNFVNTVRKKKPIIYCPAYTHEDMAFTGTPNTLISYPHRWTLETIIENFDDVYSEKHHTGFKLFTKIDFFKVLSYFVYQQHHKNTGVHYPLEYIGSIDSVVVENEADAAGWYCIRNYFNPLVYLKNKEAVNTVYHLENKKYSIPILAEFFYFNLDDCVYITPCLLLEWKNRFNFQGSELLKPFFTAFLTGEVHDFLKLLDKKGLTLNKFLENFKTWYERLYPATEYFSREFSKNPEFYRPLIKVLAGGDFDWVKENGVSFTNNPSAFGKNYEQYYDWASGLLTQEGTLNMDIMLEKLEKSRFTRFGIVDINVEFKDVFEDSALIKKNERLVESLMTSPLTLKTYVFLHSLWEKEIFDKQASLKNKFDHYLVEFDSCIVSDNEVYNNYLNISKNEDSLNLEHLPTSFCGWWRLLEVDNRLVLPIKTRLRILVTSSDVLHSWAVPSLGVKIDACPGRLNCVYVYIKRPGVFHGQCSELCGVKHGFMPIVVHAVTRDKYNRWFADTCEFIN